MDTSISPSARTYQRPAWLTLIALALVIAPMVIQVLLLASGYGAFDGRGILLIASVCLGGWILSTGKGEPRG